MYKNSLLVEILVETTDAKQKYQIATGYPVARDLIITAHHALFPKYKNDKPKTVCNLHLRWYYQKEQARERIRLNPDDCIVWNGHEKLGLDVVLLECPFPPEVKGIGYLSKREWTSGTRWESEGFARAGTLDDERPPTELWGTLPNPGDADKPTFTIGVDYETDLKAGWKGASGSPVMLGSGQIVGIIESSLDNFDGKRFVATSVRTLLQDKEFRQKIHYDERKKQLLWAKRALETRLDNHQPVSNELGKCLEQSGASSQAIVDILLNDRPLEDILHVLIRANAYFIQAKDHASVECVQKLLHILLPSVFDPGIIAAVNAAKDEFRYCVLSLPVATRTAAEIIMAGVDVRATVFKALGKDEIFPEGVYSLPDPPEGGIQKQGENYINSFHAHMIKKFTGSDVPPHAQSETKIKMVANRLKFLATHPSQAYSHYYLYYLPEDEDEGKFFAEVISELQIKYPAVAFINLSTDEDILLSEHEKLLPFTEFFSEQNSTPE